MYLQDLHKFKNREWVRYSDFGARDGKTDDIDAIAAATQSPISTDFQSKPMKATYYMGKERTAIIRTNTDFGGSLYH
jgi:hypothetical protein